MITVNITKYTPDTMVSPRAVRKYKGMASDMIERLSVNQKMGEISNSAGQEGDVR